MKVHFFTIVLDGMPWIAHHLAVFNTLALEWDWTVVEGVALPVKDTSWCRPLTPRLSEDGTSAYLQAVANSHPRVTWISRPEWAGKAAMCNAALASLKDPGLLWQIDADEIWSAGMFGRVHDAFVGNPGINCADFYCRYFVGSNLVVDRVPETWTNHFGWEWRRVWRFEPGMRFATHEPPLIEGQERRPLAQPDTEFLGCVFDHYAYALEAQVEFKERYYHYTGAVAGWKRLQKNTVWPAHLADFLPWITDKTTARPL